MTIPISLAEKLVALQNGEKIPFSKLKHPVIESMLDNGILVRQIQGRSKSIIYCINRNSMSAYVENHFGIQSLEIYIEAAKRDDLSRGEAIDVSSNSKLKSIRTFKGFLVNSYEPVECHLHHQKHMIDPNEGTFTFIYDYTDFFPSPDITIIGIENPENFRHIHKQKSLFGDIRPLFVSRYPQSNDLIKWLLSIPNPYLHFGDFDFAGLNIYVNEFKKHLQGRANFFLPYNIEDLLSTRGNRDNYHKQTLQFNKQDIDEPNVHKTIHLIEQYKKGLEQEIYARLK